MKASSDKSDFRSDITRLVVPSNATVKYDVLTEATLSSKLDLVRVREEILPDQLKPRQRQSLAEDFEATIKRVCDNTARTAFYKAKRMPYRYVEVIGISLDKNPGVPGIIRPEISTEMWSIIAGAHKDQPAHLVFSFGVFNGQETLGNTISIKGSFTGSSQGELDGKHPWRNFFIPAENNEAMLSIAQLESSNKNISLPGSGLVTPRGAAVSFLKSDKLKLPSAPTEVQVSKEITARFHRDRKEALTTDEWQNIYNIASEQYASFQSRFKHNLANIDYLEDIGEAATAHRESKLIGRPRELPASLNIRAFAFRQAYLQYWNHPGRLLAQEIMEQRGYIPIPSKYIPVLQRNKDHAFGYGDLVRRVAPTPDGNDDDLRTTNVMLKGLFTFANNMWTTNYFNGSSMMTHSPFSAATLGLLGSTSFFPIDARWSTEEARKHYRDHVAHLIESDPCLDLHLYNMQDIVPEWTDQKVKERVKERAFRNLGPTLKIDNLDKALQEAITCREMGFRSIRIYDPRATSRMQKALEMLKNGSSLEKVSKAAGLSDSSDSVAKAVDKIRSCQALDDVAVYVGRVVDVATARRLQNAGANAIEVGIADGSICKTGVAADVNGCNMQVLYELTQSGLSIPASAEGGVDTKFGILAGVGGASSFGSGKVYGGRIEQAPVLFYRSTPDGKSQAKDYAGEASFDSKIEGNNVDAFGQPCNEEGETGFTEYDHKYPSSAFALWKMLEALAKTGLMQRMGSIEKLTHEVYPRGIKLVQLSARESIKPHGRGAREGRPISVQEYSYRASKERARLTAGADIKVPESNLIHPELEIDW